MKRIVAIGLLAVFTLSSTELQQLMKLPYIFKHYAEHHKVDSALSFIGFLDMHYLHGSPKDKDYDEDMKLPFKTPVKTQAGQTAAFVLSADTGRIIKPTELSPQKKTIFDDRFIVIGYSSSVWQPPKFS